MKEFPIAVIMERRRLNNPWVDAAWEAVGVVPAFDDADPAPRCIVDEAERGQWRFGGFALELFRDEAENYFANITAPIPKVFVMWRMDGERARPAAVSVSYGEAARWLDSGDFVNTHYKPEPKKKVKRNDPLGLDRRRT